MEIDVSKGIKIAGFHIAVKTGKQINEKLKDSGFYGRTYHSEKEILIDNSFTPQQVSNTIIHEVIHTMDNSFDTHLSESQVKRLANGWQQVMEQYGITFTVGNKVPESGKRKKGNEV